ncbi:chlorophyll synthesis pathway protein BchC [soil metagenome]
MKAGAIIFNNAEVELSEYDVRELRPGEVLIESACTCISPGTELRCLRGKQPGVPDKPYVPGYTLTGTITASRAKKFKEGCRVSAFGAKDAGHLEIGWGGHLSHGIVDEAQLVEIPGNVDFADASLGVLGSIAYHGFVQSRAKKNENAAVVGLGVIGQLCARLLAAHGVNVAGCDKSHARVNLAVDSGVKSVVGIGSVSDSLRPIFPSGVTLLVDSTGIPQVIDDAISLLYDIPFNDSRQPFIRYVLQGSYEDSFTVDYMKAFMKQAAFIVPRSNQKRDRIAFLKMLADKKVSVTDLIHNIERPENAAEAYANLMVPDSVPGTIIFRWK